MAFRPIVYPEQYGPGKGWPYFTEANDFTSPGPETPGDVGGSIWVIGYDVARVQKAHILLYYLSQQGSVDTTASAAEEPDTLQVWQARRLRSEWTTPLYGLGGVVEDGQAAPVAPQDEILQPWRRQHVRSYWTTPTYGLNGIVEDGQATPVVAAQDETPQPWAGRRLQRPSYLPAVQQQLRNAASAEDATTTPADPNAPLYVTYEGRQYRFPYHLLFGALDPSSAPVQPAEESQAQTWIRRVLKSQWETPLYGLNGVVEDGQATPVVTPQDEIPQPWQKRTLRSEWTTPAYGLNGNVEDGQAAPVFAEQPDTLPQWRARILPNQLFIKAARVQLGNAASADDAHTDPGSPSLPFFVTYEGREYAFRRDLYFAPTQDLSGPGQIEVNPHFLAKHRPGRHLVAAHYYYRNPDTSQSAPSVPAPTVTRKRYPQWMRRLELELIR